MTDGDGRVVLITGCSSGIGRALTRAFGEAGHRIVATARRPETVTDLAGERTLIQPLDVTERASIEAAVAATVEWAGGIDILVNNAGYGLIGPVAELDDVDLREQLETNVVGAVAAVRAVVPHMAAQRRGCIVNIGSVSSLVATPYGGAYSASKAALHLLSDALRAELLPFGIDVVVVRAGAVATHFADAAARRIDRDRDPSSLYRDRVEGMEQRAAMSRNLAMPADAFARRVVRAVTRPHPPAVLKVGGGAFLVPAVSRLPKKLLARMLARKFGLV
jgi:NAD(P)-dependent dehydrogenase (short-subunit alcohol dehydrogenase family)